MAERKKSTGSRGGSKKSSGDSKKSSGGSKGSGRSSSRSSSQRTPTATERAQPSERSPSGGDNDGEGNMPKAQEAQTGGKDMGRPPADEPDVYVYVPKVKVGELCIDVERLEAHLALRAEVANLVKLVAGVHVGIDKVKIDLKDVEAECELKVRLENTYNILDRTLSTLDENPEVVERLLDTADNAVDETGQIGKEATGPGGALSELGSGLGDSLGNLTGSIGDSLSSVTQKANPKQLASGNGGGGSRSSASSNGSSPARTAATIGAAGLLSMAGAALLGGGRKGRFGRRGTLEKVIDKVRP
jgi:hypothetical protein